MFLNGNRMRFEVNESANRASFILCDKPESATVDSDFWRLILDDGMRTEIPVISAMQNGKVEMREDMLIIEYNELVSEYGDRYDVLFRITVEVNEKGLFIFTPWMENHGDARVNECFCPLADFTELYGEKKERRHIYAGRTWISER